jgi:hypothetical protein
MPVCSARVVAWMGEMNRLLYTHGKREFLHQTIKVGEFGGDRTLPNYRLRNVIQINTGSHSCYPDPAPALGTHNGHNLECIHGADDNLCVSAMSGVKPGVVRAGQRTAGLQSQCNLLGNYSVSSPGAGNPVCPPVDVRSFRVRER